MPTYTGEHIDRLVDSHIKLRSKLREQGQLHLGQPVHALAGNISAQQEAAKAETERADKKAESKDKMKLEREKLAVARLGKEVPEEFDGHCMKCQAKKTFPKKGEIRHKNGNMGVYGPCPDCGSEIHRLVGRVTPKKKAAAK